MTEKGYAAQDWLKHLGEPEPEPIPIDRPRLAEKPAEVETSRRRDIPYRTQLEVAASTSEHPDWLLHGFVALGALTEVDGKIKSSGKTTLVTHLVAAILDGHPFLGQPTMKTNVVYLTEQTEATYREALGRAGLLARGVELRLVFRGDVSTMPWAELVAQVAADAKRDGYGLLVVDTLGKLAGIVNENDAGEGARAMVPLQDAAHAGMAVLVCRHDRKSGGEVGESGRGSSAISGDVDVILQLRRSEGNVPKSRRVIESLSRYTETPEKIVIELTDDGFSLLGDEEAVSLADGVRIPSALLHEQFEQKESWTSDELVNETGLTRAAIQRSVKQMRVRGEKVDEFTDDGGKPRRGHPPHVPLGQRNSFCSYPRSIRAERNGYPVMTPAESVSARPKSHPVTAYDCQEWRSSTIYARSAMVAMVTHSWRIMRSVTEAACAIHAVRRHLVMTHA